MSLVGKRRKSVEKQEFARSDASESEPKSSSNSDASDGQEAFDAPGEAAHQESRNRPGYQRVVAYPDSQIYEVISQRIRLRHVQLGHVEIAVLLSANLQPDISPIALSVAQ